MLRTLKLAYRELHDEWLAVGRGLKAVAVLLLVLGVIAASVGFTGDVLHWWDKAPFSTNFLSGFTGACFGVPFAILILRYLTQRQAEQAQIRRTRRLRTAALLDLGRAAKPFIDLDEFHDASAPVIRLFQAVEEIRGAARQCDAADYDEAAPALAELRSFMQEKLAEIEDDWQVLIDRLPWIGHLHRDWTNLVDKWRFLNDYVKPQVLEENMTWLDDETHAELQVLLYETEMPFKLVEDLSGGKLRDYIEALADMLRQEDGPTVSDRGGDSSPLVVGLGKFQMLDATEPSVIVSRVRESISEALSKFSLNNES